MDFVEGIIGKNIVGMISHGCPKIEENVNVSNMTFSMAK
jgi:hypothetical protein